MDRVMQYIMIAVVVVIIIAMVVMMSLRNKKETQKLQEQTNSLKVGDRVLTTSGVYGTVTELNFTDTQKLVVIETGGKTKSYLTVDAYAIYSILTVDNKPAQVTEKNEQPKETAKKETVKEEKKEEVVSAEQVQKPAKKTTRKKTETK